ncbi:MULTISPECIES: DUF4185 domain-containing protein [Gordonia]|uniref:DUF4185 domain-containing protein n=1 Tax=Gordonia TaxID=2053 RepID=UPI0002A630D0|nr:MULTISPECIES: DUF4185 domain-containing protein [Gordonia]KAF0971460.1 hypothetical protein BPODLACK_00646 [Gordonia sp. YY1]MBA5846448.1 DUF4185 domain-containing protein [Gordonia amicalis]MCZ0915210.1 DUF4185 domain-containing protein [Gordonia amicalis]MDV7100691.1 DUF4185 domain-containing protein [Gordonia amicalis]MDV7172514.1 DUF4185 domain-containing protein [Gordonia amicalis]
MSRRSRVRLRPLSPARRTLVIGGLTIGLAAGLLSAAPPAGAAVCNVTGITGGDVGSTGSTGSSDLGWGSADFGSYRAGGKKPQGPLPKLKGATTAVSWVTGPRSPERTDTRFGITATDVGVPWENGSGQILMAFGDTWGRCAGQMVWRHNTMLRSDANSNLDKAIRFPTAIPGAVRSGASVTPAHPTYSQPMFNAIGVRNTEVGRIPTGGISVNGIQFLSFMSIHKWLGPGRWSTNYSAIAVSRNNGQTWTVDNNTIRVNLDLTVPGVPQIARGHSRFQMGAFLRSGEYIYQYGTPNGRHGSAFVARFRPGDILNLSRYQYFRGGDGWSPNPADAAPIVGLPVSEMSVAYNAYLKKFVMLTERAGTIMMRTSPTPVGPWSGERVLIPSAHSSGLYTPYIHPRSSGKNLYFVVSRWDDYNVMLARTDLSKL